MKYRASGLVASLPSSKRIPACIMGLLAGCAIALAQPGTINTYAGAYPTGWGGPPLRAVLSGGPGHMAQDANGNIYIAALARIFKLSPDGILTLFAGTGVRASTGDGGPALQARVNCGFFSGIAVDPQGNVVFAETPGHKIRLISPEGVIRTIAGTGVAGYAGDSGPANVALLRQPQGMVFDSAGNLYFSDAGNFRIRRITPGGTISTMAGNGTSAFGGDGGPATQASLSGVSDVAMDSAGNLYVADSFSLRVRRVAPDGTITTVAGVGQPGSDVTDSHGNPIDWFNMCALAIDRSDNLYIALEGHVWKRDTAGKITVVAGTGGFSIEDYLGPAIEAPLFVPLGLLVDRSGNLLLGLSREQRVAKIDPAGILSTLVGE